MKEWLKKEALNAVLKALATFFNEAGKILDTASKDVVTEAQLEKEGKGVTIEVIED